MKRKQKAQTFRQQMAQSMAELRSIMLHGQSPTANGHLTVRTIEVLEPGEYDARTVRATREAMRLSQAVFARVMGVSDVLVRSWERGRAHAKPAGPAVARLHPRSSAGLGRG